MSDTVYIVTRGEYSDFRNVQVFSDEDAAKKYADLINASDPYAHAGVEGYELRDTDCTMPMWAAKSTTISHAGAVLKSVEETTADECGDYAGKATTRVEGGRMALEPAVIRTYGDASRVPQAHSDAVAKYRAEVMGL
ncbi:hypothetical protein ACIQMR_35245 [Streptomyces sp. NPDC091376]|uniref:hypothetical protein n=1 Tax=Streptomyces sp. NPDC091376 TaxID=3365994 RepID=UPI00380A134C